MEKGTFIEVVTRVIEGAGVAGVGAAGAVTLGRPVEFVAAILIDGARNLGPNVTSFPQVVEGAAVLGAITGLAIWGSRSARRSI